MVWYYAHDNRKVGPLDEAAMKALVSSQVVSSRTLVWRDGMQDWVPLSNSDLASLVPGGQPPSGPPPLRSPHSTGVREYCRTCANEVSARAVLCTVCGCRPFSGVKFCQNCAAPTDARAEICVKCGVRLGTGSDGGSGRKSRTTAGLLGIFLGSFGVHRFYLGNAGIGAAQIVVTLITFGIGGLWGLIEGIMILAGQITEDADGNPLQD